MPRLFTKRTPWSLEEDNLLRDLTNRATLTYRKMTAHFPGRTAASLQCRAQQHLGLHNPCRYQKWQYNEFFFDSPNLVNSYVAGFLAADGCIDDRPGCVSHRMILELGNEDETHLELIKNLLGYTGPIFPRNTGRSKLFSMTINSTYRHTLEVNFGLIPNKTYRLEPPEHLSWECQFSYLLGLLDGDGCVHINKEGNLSISFVSSAQKSIEWMKRFVDKIDLQRLRSTKTVHRVNQHNSANAFTLGYTGARAVCLVQLAQAFAAKHGLPILARKWNNPRLNDYITAFYAKHVDFKFDAIAKLNKLSSSP